MARLSWDSFVENRLYEIGIEKAVLAVGNDIPVSWSGLTSVEETSEDAEIIPVYQNGVRVHNFTYSMSYSASIEAFTYPDEFEYVLTEHPQPIFSMAYRTDVGSKHYKLHLVYNCSVYPDSEKYRTLTDSPDSVIFGWDLFSRPRLEYDGMDTGSHLIIDSSEANADALSQIEDILYGTETADPRFITPFEVRYLLGGLPPQEIVPHYETGLSNIISTVSYKDLLGNRGIGLYRRAPGSRLRNRDLPPGFFRLE